MKVKINQYLIGIFFLLFLISCEKKAEEQKNLSVDPKRHIELEGQPNFRDLGGYQTTDGRTVKWGQIYRSGELPNLTDQDVKKLDLLIKSI